MLQRSENVDFLTPAFHFWYTIIPLLNTKVPMQKLGRLDQYYGLQTTFNILQQSTQTGNLLQLAVVMPISDIRKPDIWLPGNI